MDNLIPVNYDTEEPTVSARDLYKALNIQSRFSRWFENNKRLFVKVRIITNVHQIQLLIMELLGN